MVLQIPNFHQLYCTRKPLLLLLSVLYMVQAAKNILPHGHVRKQSVVLKQIANLALLRRQIDALFRIEQRYTVEDNSPFVRRFNASDALERHALAAAGCAKQTEDAVVRFKGDFQVKRAERFFDIHRKAHRLTAFF